MRLAALFQFVLALWVAGAAAASAACSGQSLLGTMEPRDLQALTAAVAKQPYPQGNYWRATKDGRTVWIVGTYHLNDPRHDETIARLAPLFDDISALMLEAGPKEEAQLKDALARNPALFTTRGLVERLPPGLWTDLARALKARGIPPALGAQMQPWYLGLILSVPGCALQLAAEGNGLDKRLAALADEKGLPLRALEPYDTALKLFDDVSEEAQINMIRSALTMEPQAENLLATLQEAYFTENSRIIWELNRMLALRQDGSDPAVIEQDFSDMEEALIFARNRNWIPAIEDAARTGDVLVGFGALHLAGRDGVLALLDRAGWTLERLPADAPLP